MQKRTDEPTRQLKRGRYSEGNHGEDVKEYYFYLGSTPSHSSMKYLYKYPRPAYPYDDIVATNRNRGRGKANRAAGKQQLKEKLK